MLEAVTDCVCDQHLPVQLASIGRCTVAVWLLPAQCTSKHKQYKLVKRYLQLKSRVPICERIRDMFRIAVGIFPKVATLIQDFMVVLRLHKSRVY